MGRPPHRIKERVEGRRLLPRRGAPHRARFRRITGCDGCGPRDRAARHGRRFAGRDGPGENEGQIHDFVREEYRGELAFGRAPLSLRRARRVWFVVGLPVFLASTLGWNFMRVGAFVAAWFIGYGMIQATVPEILRQS